MDISHRDRGGVEGDDSDSRANCHANRDPSPTDSNKNERHDMHFERLDKRLVGRRHDGYDELERLRKKLM